MKRAWFVLLFVGTAHAAPATPPAGWTRNADSSAQMSSAGTTVDAYLPPTGRGSFYVTRKELKAAAEQRNAVASAELGELAQVAKRQGSAETTAFAQKVDPDKLQLEASITWRDPALELTQHARTVIAADAQRIIAVTGECVLGSDAPTAMTAACTAALATLDPELPAAQRVALAIVEGGELPPSEREGSAAPPAPAGPQVAPSRPGTTATLDGAPAGARPSTMTPAARETDRRPVYIGGFIVLMAAVFWWNRRRRDRFDREDAKQRGEPPATEPPGDDDADDLAAAARGDAPKDDP